MDETDSDVPEEVREPLSRYGRPHFRLFNSYEEQREEMYAYQASLTPEQCMARLLELITATFGEEKLKAMVPDRRIRIVKG